MLRFLFLALCLFVSGTAVSGAAVGADRGDIYKQIKSLQLEFLLPLEQTFFVELTGLAEDSFNDDEGAHQFGYGGSLALSWVAYSDTFGLRPALDISGAYSTRSDINVISAKGLALLYLDFGYLQFNPFIGAGGGYSYVFDDADGDKDNGGGFIVVGDAGVSFAASRFLGLTIGYRYIYGITDVKLDTRVGDLKLTTHQARIGIRMRF